MIYVMDNNSLHSFLHFCKSRKYKTEHKLLKPDEKSVWIIHIETFKIKLLKEKLIHRNILSTPNEIVQKCILNQISLHPIEIKT